MFEFQDKHRQLSCQPGLVSSPCPVFRDLTVFGSPYPSFTASCALGFPWAPVFGFSFQHMNGAGGQQQSLSGQLMNYHPDIQELTATILSNQPCYFIPFHFSWALMFFQAYDM